MRAILFDLFGTVVAYGDIAAGTRLSWEGIHNVTRELGAAWNFDEFVPEWEAQFRQPLSPEEDSEATPFLSKMQRFFGSLGLPRDLGAAQRAVQACLAGWEEHMYLPEDTLPALRALRERYRLALVSNFDHPPYVRAMLARMGLEGLFEDVRISGEQRIDKPDPRIFQQALRALGCAPEEALFVGDSLEADIAGARGAGCTPVLIDRKERYTEYTDLRITSLDQLAGLLESL